MNTLAVRMGSDLSAGVPYYGAQPPAADAAKIKTPLPLQYGALDARITGGWPAFEEALKANHATYQGYVYDTTPRYDEANAKLAWQRTIDKYLRG